MSDDIENKNDTNQSTKMTESHSRLPLIIFFIVILILVGGFGYGYFQLEKVNVSLANMVNGLKKETLQSQSDLKQMNQSFDNFQTEFKKTQTLAEQQNKTIGEIQSAQQGNFTKWYVAEAQYLIKMANDQLQYMHNNGLALILLQRAEQALQNSHANNLDEIQKSLANDIASLQNVPSIDTTQLYVKISTIAQQINGLPLRLSPVAEKNNPVRLAQSANLPWWKAGIDSSLSALREIVIVRHIGNQTLPLVKPEERNFLYHNLSAQLEDAMWGLLHRDGGVYQSSLDRTFNWVQQYFDINDVRIKNVLQQLQTLRVVNVQLPQVNLAQTLQLIDHYISQPETTKTE